MKKLVLPIALCLLLLGQDAFAQSRPVKGRVLDDKGEPVIGASVLIKGTQAGTITDINGEFRLDVPDDDNTLVITALGTKPQEVDAGDGSNLVTVNLQVSLNTLETIVTALGISKTEQSLGYSAQQLKSDQFENARSSNVINSIAGKVAGVRVNDQSGAVGSSSKIVIRGSSSLSGSSQPLFVVDGVPISNSIQGTSNQGVTVDYGNRGADINPDDIESMSVLKGPAATALYGSLAKDGAIIITTKKGKKGTPLSVTVNSSYRVENILVKPELQSEYAQGNYGAYSLKYTNGWGPKISDMQNTKVKDFLGRDVTLQAHPDNVSNFYQTGRTWMNDVSLLGGTDKTDYRLSFGALSTQGIVANQNLERYNLGLNVGNQFSEKVSSRVTVNYSNTKANGRPFQSSNNPNILTSSIYSIPTTVDVNDLKNHYEDKYGNQNYLSTDKTGNNPFWILNKNINSNSVDRFFGSGYIEYKPWEFITISENLGFDMYNEQRSQIVRQGTAGDIGGSYSQSNLLSKRINNDLMATFQKDLNKDFNLRVMVGHNILDRQISGLGVAASNLTIDSLFTASNAQAAVPNQSFSKSRLVSLYSEISGSYKDMVYLSITGRNEWSSTLPLQNRSYFYPSVSGSFVFTELMDNKNILSFGKIRASWADVGSDSDPYVINKSYSPASNYFLQYVDPNLFPQLGEPGFTAQRLLPNPDLKPQRARSIEFGADLRFFNNRIGLDLTYYQTKTRNQIIALDVPLSTGYFAKLINAGLITNKGYEVILHLEPVRNFHGFSWEIMTNFSHNKQVVNELEGDLQYYAVESGWSGLSIKAPVGGSFALYGSKWRRSPDGQFVINPTNGLRMIDNDKYIGDINPNYLLGINNTFSYKGFSLGFLIDIRQGGVFYSGTVANLRSSGMAIETQDYRDGIFVDKGVNAVGSGDNVTYVPNETPVQSMQDFWGNYSSTTNTEGNVFDASFVKLRQLTFTYSFPQNFVPFNNVIKGLDLGFEARNLWLIKSYVPHVDPESNYFGAGSTGDGVEFNSFPTTRSFGVNLKVKL